MITERSFTYPFKDKEWGSKFLIGSLLTLAGYIVPIVPILFVWGYVVRTMRHTIDTGEDNLPEWDNWGDLGLKGISYALLYFVYLLPGLVLLASAVMTFVAGMLISGTTGQAESAERLVSWVVALGTSSIVLAIGISLLALLALLAGALAAPVAIARFAATDDFAAALELHDIWDIIRTQIGDFVLVTVIGWGVGYVIASIAGILCYTVCLCLLIPFVSSPLSLYKRIFSMTLFARLYRQWAIGKTGAATAASPEPPAVSESETAVDETDMPTLHDVPIWGLGGYRGESPTEEPTPATPVAPASDEGAAPALAISHLELPARIEATLKDGGFTAVGQVLEALGKGEKELLSVKGLGPKSLETLKARLQEQGFLH